ncbi:MAG: pyruvate kinase [Oscillospiraceae bacterium]|nr:pyruvate kinase [Oscillospiraceae bacterium]
MRKTKIICTIGPASSDVNTIKKMIEAGMNVARFNMSHASHDILENMVSAVKKAGQDKISLLIDTKGPEVRIGKFEKGSVSLSDGDSFRFYKNLELGNAEGVGVIYKKLIDCVYAEENRGKGLKILLDDGKISMEVISATEEYIECRVIKGGILSDSKSINMPSFHIDMPYMSSSDREDIAFGLSLGVQFIAASFVRSQSDILMLRDYVDSLGYESVSIIAKIENQQGVDNIDSIIEAADGIMVARGDLGVEIPFIRLPALQKTMIEKCVRAGKIVVTATQMLESMTQSPRPTRAEISDVANAVFDGTSAVMLSGESAAGKYPVESTAALSAICEEAENNIKDLESAKVSFDDFVSDGSIRDTICIAAKKCAESVGAKAIIAESQTGRVAKAIAHYRPSCPIIAVVTRDCVAKKLALNWGVTAVLGEEKSDSDEITRQAMDKALETGLVQKGDTVIVISSNKTTPTNETDTLNIRKI